MTVNYVTAFFTEDGENVTSVDGVILPVTEGQTVILDAGDSKRSKFFTVIKKPTLGIRTNRQVPQIIEMVIQDVFVREESRQK